MKNGQFLKKGDLMKDEPDETRDEEEEMEIFTNTNDDALTLLPPSSFQNSPGKSGRCDGSKMKVDDN